MITDEPTTKPLRLDVTHIDLAMVEDQTGSEFVIMRLVEAQGLLLDIPMRRDLAEKFGESLREYASAEHIPAWLS
jgi:hypothetical protein